MAKAYDRKETYDLEEVLSNLGDLPVNFDGDNIKMNSLRYRVFAQSQTCAKCGLRGSFFAKERDRKTKKREVQSETYHFNLYAVNEKGQEVMMIKDRISEGHGPENFQTICINHASR